MSNKNRITLIALKTSPRTLCDPLHESFQARIEQIILKYYQSCHAETDPVLLKCKHIEYLKKSISILKETYEVHSSLI